MQLATAGLGGLEADGEPEPEAAAIRPALLEGAEQIFDSSRRQAAAFVLDLEKDAVGGCHHGQGDFAAIGRELERILEKVRDGRRDDLAIALDGDAAVDRRDLEAKTARLRLNGGAHLELSDEVRDRNAITTLFA